MLVFLFEHLSISNNSINNLYWERVKGNTIHAQYLDTISPIKECHQFSIKKFSSWLKMTSILLVLMKHNKIKMDIIR